MPDWGLGGDGHGWANYAHISLGDTNGVAVVSGSGGVAPFPYGNWTEITVDNASGTTSLPLVRPCVGFCVQVVTINQIADVAIDIGVSTGAGAVSTLVQRLYVSGGNQAFQGGRNIYIPIALPKDARIWARTQSSIVTATTTTIALSAISSGFRGAVSLGRCVSYNLTGTAVEGDASAGAMFVASGTTGCLSQTVSGVSAGTKGTWNTISNTGVASAITTTTQYPISAITFAFIRNSSAGIYRRWYVDIGYGADTTIIVPDICVEFGNTPALYGAAFVGPIPVSIPAGATVQARAACHVTTSTNIEVIMYAWS